MKYLVDLYKEVIMTLPYYAKEDIRTRLCLSQYSGSQLETSLCPISITWLRLRAVDISVISHEL